MSQLPHTAARYVLDTNIWLDWFVFAHDADAPIAVLKQVVSEQQASVVMVQAMWDEWVDVLGRAQFGIEPERQADILTQTRALVTWTSTPPTPFERIRCSDKDDQVFIDTALALNVDWLISKDKHLLSLRQRAKKRGVQIATPEQWVRMCEQVRDQMRGQILSSDFGAEMTGVVHA
jgi:putative PIN family toxin of toxin-antitoxin system